ncbi:MAG TPA: transaldolase family protein, partial [Clostridia bacterium]|nr:transaldolase family protein [Clostridia bacterium]
MGFLSKVLSQTPTRFWVNNPSYSDMDKSIAAGARNVTTNPAYCSKLIKSEPEYMNEVIDSIIADTADDDIAADLVYQKASKRAMDRFIGIYNESGGKEGYVTVQLDPRLDGNADTITEGAVRHAKLGPNYMAKIPVTAAGLKAIENVLRMGIPVCATEIFAISQAISACEIYKRITEKTGKNVPLYVTHITGIFDEYLAKYAALNKIDINPQVL